MIYSFLHSPLVTQPLRSSMTKIVGQSAKLKKFKKYSKKVMVVIVGDVGAIFACVAAGQAISGFATPLYNKIYVAVRMAMIMTTYYHVSDI